MDAIAEFIEEVLGDRPGFDRGYRVGDVVVDENGLRWYLVIDLGVGGRVRWLHQAREVTGDEYGHHVYSDDLPPGVPEYVSLRPPTMNDYLRARAR